MAGVLYFCIMLTTIDAQNHIYKLTIEYQEKEYTYKASMIQFHAGEERWHVYTKSRILFLIYNTARKKLREDLLHGQLPLPDDFLKELEKSFQQK